MKTIGGFLAVRNGINLDYCFVEAINSMLPICDQIVVSESESTDGTRELLDDWAKREPKLKIVSYPWTDPVKDTSWWPSWLNHPRTHLTTDHAIYLDADEIFDPASYPRIRQAAEKGEALCCLRLNFWKDAQSLIPKGVCLGHEVIRIGPRHMFFPSDYSDPLGRDKEIVQIVKRDHAVRVFHYGFLRKRDAFFRKARVVQKIWMGDYDPRLEQAEKEGGNWMANKCVSDWVNPRVF